MQDLHSYEYETFAQDSGEPVRHESEFVPVIERKSPPSPTYQKEICDAGFEYTNQICLAVEDSRHMLSLSREVLT